MPEINSAYKAVSKLVGREGQRVLEKKEFLDSVAKIDKDLAKTIEKSVGGVTNPTFELSGKVTANYNIAGLKIKNGNQEVIGTGAVSKSQPDLLEGAIVKGRFDLPNGEMVRIEGAPSEYENSLNVYTGKDKNLKRVCSANDDSYKVPVKIFDKEGHFKEFRVFDAKENTIKTVHTADDKVLEEMEVTNYENGITKLEYKWSSDWLYPCEEIFDKNGNEIHDRDIKENLNNGTYNRVVRKFYLGGRLKFTAFD